MLLVPSPTDYPSQQYYSSQPSPTSSRRSTLPTTPTFDHASLSPHPPAPLPLSGSTSYNPPFSVHAIPVGHPSTNPSGPAPAPSPVLHRAATMPMPVHANAASSAPYGMPPNTMHSLSQPGIPGGPQSTAPGYGYRASTAVDFPTVQTYDKRLTDDVHERYGDPSNFLEQSRGGTRHSGEYMREKASPNHVAAGRRRESSNLLLVEGGHGSNTRQNRPKPPNLLRCLICRKETTRAEAEYRRWYCPGGHMGEWQLVVLILSLLRAND
jgi:hypothetical protein